MADPHDEYDASACHLSAYEIAVKVDGYGVAIMRNTIAGRVGDIVVVFCPRKENLEAVRPVLEALGLVWKNAVTVTAATLPAIRRRFLCVCEGGCVRSTAMAWQLKVNHGQNAIAVGWRWNDAETLALLCEWADYVVLMQDVFRARIESRYHGKIRVVDVGRDRWGDPTDEELVNTVAKAAHEWAEHQFVIAPTAPERTAGR
jgi:hypothetical protein